MLQLCLVTANVTGHIGNDRVFVQVILDDIWHIGIDDLVIGHSGTRGIGQANIAFQPGLHQAFHTQDRFRVEYRRIQELVIDAAVDHVHGRQAVNGFHEDMIVLNHQVTTLDQFGAHALCQERMFKIGRIENARGQDNDFGVFLGFR